MQRLLIHAWSYLYRWPANSSSPLSVGHTSNVGFKSFFVSREKKRRVHRLTFLEETPWKGFIIQDHPVFLSGGGFWFRCFFLLGSALLLLLLLFCTSSSRCRTESRLSSTSAASAVELSNRSKRAKAKRPPMSQIPSWIWSWWGDVSFPASSSTRKKKWCSLMRDGRLFHNHTEFNLLVRIMCQASGNRWRNTSPSNPPTAKLNNRRKLGLCSEFT